MNTEICQGDEYIQLDIKDKLYCIKTLKHNDLIYYIKGECYNISDIYNNIVEIVSEKIITVSFETKINSNDMYSFTDHFSTLKELRKQKIEKLNTI